MGRLTDCERVHAWTRWLTHRIQADRDLLVADYKYLVRLTVMRVAVSVPRYVERDDLIGAGHEGLLKAVDTFDPERGVPFETYLIGLVRNAVLEYLRREDWAPRSIRDAIRRLVQAEVALELQLLHEPTTDELAEYLGVSPEEVQLMRMHRDGVNPVSLAVKIIIPGNEDLTLSDMLVDRGPSVAEQVFEEVGRQEIRAALCALPAREGQVMTLYYDRGLTFREISKQLNPPVSESRAFQLHGQAIARMRQHLTENRSLLVSEP